jgi:uncharacterized protein
MRGSPDAMRLVLDTHVWLEWLVFDDSRVATLRQAVEGGRARVFIDEACRAELERVLGYPLGNRPVDAARCLAEVARLAVPVTCAPRAGLPACRDPDDQKFLVLAASAGADCLVTRDRALLALDRHALSFRILVPESLSDPGDTGSCISRSRRRSSPA